MKRKILMLLCLCMAVVFALSACVGPVPGGDEQTTTGKPTEDNPQNTCEHTFSNAWSSDAKNHWHAATCEHGEVKDSLAAHADADEDGKCDVCAYELGHTHTYAKDWSTDDSYHWHAATCTHTDEKKDYMLHADIDENGKCDVCEAHVHTVDETGYCTGCGEQIEEIEINELEQLLAAVIASSKNALSGKVVYDVIIRGLTEEIQESYELDYLFATDGIYTRRSELADAATGSMLLTESWIKMGGEDEELTAIQTTTLLEEMIDAQPIAVSEDHLLGDYFAVSTLAGEYGAEGILYALYEASQLETASEYAVQISTENKTATLHFNVLIINEDTAEGEDDGVDYYEVEVAFSYSDKYTLTSLEIICNCYTNSLANEAENDYTYDQENKTITMKDTAKADTYTYQVVQTEGERVALDMTAVEPFIPTDVTVYVDEELTEKAESFNITVGDNSVELFFGCAPDGSFIRFAQGLDITVTNTADGSAAAGLGAYLTGEVIQIIPAAAGEYTITVTYGENVQTIAVVVEGVELSGDGSFEVEITDTYAWVDVYEFTATESGAYTFYLPANFGAWDAEGYDDFSMNPWVDYQGMGGYDATAEHSFTVDIAAGETYRFYCSAMAKGTYTIGYSFEAKDVEPEGGDDEGDDPSVTLKDANGLGGEYVFNFVVDWTLTFTPAANGATAGTLSVVDFNNKTNTYAYTIENGLYVFTTEGVSVELNADDNMWYYKDNTMAMAKPFADATEIDGGDEEETNTLVLGENTIAITDEIIADGGIAYTFVVTEAGTYTFAGDFFARIINSNGDQVGVGVAYLDAGVYTVNLGTMVITVAGDYALNITYEAPVTEEENILVIGSNTIAITDDIIAEGGVAYTFEVTEAGTYTFAGDFFVRVIDADGNPIGVGVVYLEEGTYTVNLGTMVISVAGDYPLTISYEAPGGGDDDAEPDGSDGNPYIIEEMPFDIVINGKHDLFYTWTATEDCTLVVVRPASNVYVSISGAEYDNNYADLSYTIYASEGDVIVLNPWGGTEGDTTTPYTYSITKGAAVIEGSVDKPFSVSTWMPNSFEYAGGEDAWVWFTYNAWFDGTLTLTFDVNANVKYGANFDALTLVSDELVFVIDIEADSNIYIAVQAADLEAATIGFTAAALEKLGTSGNPIVLEDIGDFTCEYDGADVWYSFTATESGYVTLSSAFATVKLGGGNSTYSIAYNDSESCESVRFYATAGQTTYIVVGDWEDGESAEIAVVMSFVAGEHEPDGSYEYPFSIETIPGDYTCAFDGGWSYIWYKVVIGETGYLTVSSSNELAMLVVSSSTSAYTSDAVTGNGIVSYAMGAGTYYIGIMGDGAEEIPFSVFFDAGELEADGSARLPYTAEIGENVCEFPGGMNPIWYQITVDSDCTITLSSSFEKAWLILSPEADVYANGAINNASSVMFGAGEAVSIEVTAGTYYIGIADWDESEVEIPFTVTVE